ncbi:MAG: hypothetical protein JXA82_07765 [Sedimentisphaerales bacterium]|nr:hypothetical protein [Sedimentisphaerales bacterium]
MNRYHFPTTTGDLKSARWIYCKGFLFLTILLLSVTIILIDHFSWKLSALLALTVWSSARFYYFLFYVIEKYVDPSYKFAGIFSFLLYLVKRRASTHHPQ